MKFSFFRKRSNGQEHDNGNVSALFQDEPVITDADRAQDEVALVIALALHMYMKRLREYEKTSITIQKVIKPYSPWSSKIYGLRQQPMYIPGLKARLK